MTKKIERILIAIKPWETELPISPSRASCLARGLNAEVALTSCVALSGMSDDLAWTDPALSAEIIEHATSRQNYELAQLERLAEPLRADGVPVTTRVRSGARAAHGILDEAAAWQADLLIAGVHEPPSTLRPRLLDVDWQLMRLCPCPLLLARASRPERYKNIVAAVDPLHGHAEPAGIDQAVLAVAQYLRDACEAQLRVVNAYPNPDEYEIVSSIEVEPGILYGTENIEAAHTQAVIDLINECGVADSEIVLRPGKPAAVIAELANNEAIDLVVLGSIKRGQIEATLLGSTAERVVDRALCDVLLVKLPTP
jgi:universal stress protein E